MFYHCVHFWLRDGLSDDELSQFADALRGLGECETVKSVRVGVPAQTQREVVDNSFAYQLLVIFDDKAGHDAYQDNDQRHQDFIDNFNTFWTKVLIYDSLEAPN